MWIRHSRWHATRRILVPMTKRLRIPAVLAVTVVSAIAGVATLACGSDDGDPQPAPVDMAMCPEGTCIQDTFDPDAGVCPVPDTCATNFMCPPGCHVV
jgi:hypothetical protein